MVANCQLMKTRVITISRLSDVILLLRYTSLTIKDAFIKDEGVTVNEPNSKSANEDAVKTKKQTKGFTITFYSLVYIICLGSIQNAILYQCVKMRCLQKLCHIL